MNILLSAVGRRSYLVKYFQKVVHPFGGKVYATNTTPEATGFVAADAACVAPPSSSKNYVDFLISICNEWHVKLLFSLHDWDAPVIAKAKERFLEVGTLPVVGPCELYSTCLDKYATVKAMEELGIKTPKTFLSLTDALQYNQFPMIVKPRWGQGSLGLFKVTSKEELFSAYSLSTNQASTFAEYYAGIDKDEPQVIIQECINAMEYGCDIINDLSGNFRRAFIKHKLAMRAGETDAAESVSMPAIEHAAAKIGIWSKHLGCMDSDWFIDENGEPLLIELNPRFGGGYPFTHCAGANIPLACVNWAHGDDTDAWYRDYEIGVRCFKEIALHRV